MKGRHCPFIHPFIPSSFLLVLCQRDGVILYAMNLVVWMSAISALMPTQQVSSVEMQAYREYAVTLPGDAVRGKAIFQREAIGCANCHTIGEGSRRAGPDLLAIGDKYPRAELILAVLEPSAFILTGYAATTFVTESGTVHSGIIARRDPEEIELLLATNHRIRLASNTTVKEQRSSVSLMPSGVERLLAPQEFSDLISYLATLKQPTSKAVTDLRFRRTLPVSRGRFNLNRCTPKRSASNDPFGST